jgi:hypothetical protein
MTQIGALLLRCDPDSYATGDKAVETTRGIIKIVDRFIGSEGEERAIPQEL